MKKLDWSGCLSGLPVPAVPVVGGGLWKAGVLSSLEGAASSRLRDVKTEGGPCGCSEWGVHRRIRSPFHDGRGFVPARQNVSPRSIDSTVSALTTPLFAKAGDHGGLDCDVLQSDWEWHLKAANFWQEVVKGEKDIVKQATAMQELGNELAALVDVKREACRQQCEWAQSMCGGSNS